MSAPESVGSDQTKQSAGTLRGSQTWEEGQARANDSTTAGDVEQLRQLSSGFASIDTDSLIALASRAITSNYLGELICLMVP